MGKPTDAKAEQWRQQMNKSFQSGGSNEHLAKAYNFIPHINAVEVVKNTRGAIYGTEGYLIVAEAKAPMFEVV